MGLEWVWGLLQPGFVRWAPPSPPLLHKTTLNTAQRQNIASLAEAMIFVMQRTETKWVHWNEALTASRGGDLGWGVPLPSRLGVWESAQDFFQIVDNNVNIWRNNENEQNSSQPIIVCDKLNLPNHPYKVLKLLIMYHLMAMTLVAPERKLLLLLFLVYVDHQTRASFVGA